jgi:hypothetical protein
MFRECFDSCKFRIEFSAGGGVVKGERAANEQRPFLSPWCCTNVLYIYRTSKRYSMTIFGGT